MTTLSAARQKWKETIRKYQKIRPTRTAVLGDGRGTAEANLVVPGRSDYVFARDTIRDANFFQVLNNGAVQPAFNLPVVIGLPVPGEKVEEPQIIGIHYAGLGSIPSSTIPKVGPHHQQHEFRGGDDILLDSRQFLSGLVHPTDPASMKVQVESFIYFWDTWQRWEISQSKDLTEYKPSSGYILWVLIALDPETGGLVYRPGVPFATGSQDVIHGTFTPIPAPAGNELPLGYVRLASTTTTIDWTSSSDNIGDARLWVNPPMLNILDRLRQLEGYTGNPPDLMMMGAASYSVTPAVMGTVTGTGAASRIAYWDGTSNIISSANFQFDGTRLGLGSDGIAPTTDFIITGIANTGGQPSALRVLGGAHTTLPASAESNDVLFSLNRTVQWETGTLTTQRAFVITPPTYAFVGASTITTAATVAISGAPVAGTNATITTSLALWIQAGNALFAGSVFSSRTTTVRYTEQGFGSHTTSSATSNTTHKPSPYIQWLGSIWNGASADNKIIEMQLLGVSSQNSQYYLEVASSDVADIINVRGDTGAIIFGRSLQVGTPTGGDKGAGTINVATNIFLNNSAYGNPDYALEYWLRGKIEKYARNIGADGYRRMSLDEIELYIKENIHLPRISDEPSGIFDRADIALEKIEEIFTHLIDLHKRIRRLEGV